MNYQHSRLKVAWYASCVGVGGADACMLQLVNHCHNIDWTGIYVHEHVTFDQYEWFWRMVGNKIPIHQLDHQEHTNFDGPQYHDSYTSAMWEAAKGADAIITWCVPGFADHAPILNIPVFEWIQNTDEWARGVIERNTKNVAAYVACCKSAMAAVADEKKMAKSKVIYNCIDPSRVTPRFGREFIRKEWGLTDEHKILLFMGRFVEEKHPVQMIQTLQQLPDNWIGLFVGRGYQEEGLYHQAQSWLNDPTRVRFMPPQYHVGDVLASADCFFLPADFEGHPLAVAESWLAGTPVVCTRLPVMLEMEQMFGSQLVSYIPVNPSTEQCVEAVLSSQMEEFGSILNLAREACWQNFTVSTVAAQWEEALHQMVQEWRTLQRRPVTYAVSPREAHGHVPTIEMRNG